MIIRYFKLSKIPNVGAPRGHVICYTVFHVTILVNFEFFAGGSLLGGEHEHRNIQYMLPTRSHGFWIQSIGETTLEELFFVSNRTYVLLWYYFPAHHGPSPWYSLFYHLIKYSRTVLSTVF